MADAQRRGFDPARLRHLRERLADAIDTSDVPGAVSVLARGDEVLVDAHGVMGPDDPTPMGRDTIFRISSMTKPITAALAVALVEDGTLRLDDPVDPWLPELADRRVLRSIEGALDDTVPAERPISLRDLLTFRSGYGAIAAAAGTHPIQRAEDALELHSGIPRPAWPPEPDEWIRRLGTLPLQFQPGSQWAYDTSAQILGVLLARASGHPLGSVLRARLLAPLGLLDTGFSIPAGDRRRVPTSVWTDPGSGRLGVFDPAIDGQWSRPPAFPSAASGLLSTADDLLVFARMLLARGLGPGGRVLSRHGVETMTRPQITDEQADRSRPYLGPGRSWGFGIAVTTEPRGIAESAGTFGWDGGLGTAWRIDPHEDLVAILLTQRAWTSPAGAPLFDDFFTGAYAALDD